MDMTELSQPFFEEHRSAHLSTAKTGLSSLFITIGSLYAEGRQVQHQMQPCFVANSPQVTHTQQDKTCIA